ncbi:MAG: hypothetical protein ABSD97_17275 [Acidimicrobiales bacterium]
MGDQDWRAISITGITRTRSPRFSGVVEIEAMLSREPPDEWAHLFEEALRLDPARRDASGVQVGSPIPMIWASVTPERADTVEAVMKDAIEVANYRYGEFLRLPPSAG